MDSSKFDADKWLLELHSRTNEPQWKRLCFLVGANGGFSVYSYGFISTNQQGHRRGIEQQEAAELTFLGGFVDGLLCMGSDFLDRFDYYWIPYSQKWGLQTPESLNTLIQERQVKAVTCPSCGGRGKVGEKPCTRCQLYVEPTEESGLT